MPLASEPGSRVDELRLAARNHAMPLEALRWPITPVGLHYLLIHYDVPLVDPATWRLEVGGAVAQPLTLDARRASRAARGRARRDDGVRRERPGAARAPADQPAVAHRGGRHRDAGAASRSRRCSTRRDRRAGAVDVVFSALDRGVEGGVEQRYERSLPLAEALGSGAVLAYEMNGAPLPPQHGFPLRLVVPGWYGMTNVKWLTEITVVEEPFGGYQVGDRATGSGRREDEEGRPVTRMRPRSLMVPPGIPDFFTRERIVEPGACRARGTRLVGARADRPRRGERRRRRVWADAAAHARPRRSVGVGAAGRSTGSRGARAPSASAPARPTRRATTQPLEPEWNVGGYENNAVQRVPVTVR